MRITLVYNSTAGDGVDQGELTKLLEAAGHVVRVVSRKGDWRKALKKPADLVVAVGGDGHFARWRWRWPKAIRRWPSCPMGTANNVGRTLELLGDARPVIESWERLEAEPFDVGVVGASWGEARFLSSRSAAAPLRR